MSGEERVTVAGFVLVLDRYYQPDTHMWVSRNQPGRVRIGMDALGIETSGTLSELSFAEVGTELIAGRPFGQLEAVKFVGPLISPVSGRVAAANHGGHGPGLAERDPYGAGWLIEAEREGPVLSCSACSPTGRITAWFVAGSPITDWKV